MNWSIIFMWGLVGASGFLLLERIIERLKYHIEVIRNKRIQKIKEFISDFSETKELEYVDIFILKSLGFTLSESYLIMSHLLVTESKNEEKDNFDPYIILYDRKDINNSIRMSIDWLFNGDIYTSGLFINQKLRENKNINLMIEQDNQFRKLTLNRNNSFIRLVKK